MDSRLREDDEQTVCGKDKDHAADNYLLLSGMAK